MAEECQLMHTNMLNLSEKLLKVIQQLKYFQQYFKSLKRMTQNSLTHLKNFVIIIKEFYFM